MDFPLQTLATILYVLQLFHSAEELVSGFHEKWFFKKLSFRFFLSFEIAHNVFWGLVIFLPLFPYRIYLLGLFALLMFANGVEHFVWYLWKKEYVPGLVTAVLHIIIFAVFFLSRSASWE